MDPITALSTASCIVQLLDFGLRVVSKGNQIYRSVDGSLTENLDLELVTNDLLVIQTKLQCCRPTSSVDGLWAAEDSKALDALCNACTETAERLLQKLNMVKAQGRFRRWKSLRQALKSVWSKPEIEEMARTLQGFRSELQLRVMVSLRSKLDSSAVDLSQQSAKLDKTAVQILAAMRQNKDSFDVALSLQENMLDNKLGKMDAILHQTGNEMKNAVISVGEDLERFKKISPEDDFEVSYESRVKDYAVPAIIESLAFPGMHDRFDKVVEAHAQTYSWIFDPKQMSGTPRDSFSSWLINGDRIYWIMGKAASGKSTLMRYIFEHLATLQHLKRWAGGERLTLAKFYFWGTGSQIQKSQLGLFRSLLHQIFSADPSLVPKVLPKVVHDLANLRFKVLRGLATGGLKQNWSFSELKHLLWASISDASTSVKYCFLIDGLDEFDGDYLELGSFFKQVSTMANSKLCLSSRPKLAFEEQFDGFPRLRLQDLTVQDITLYIRDNLNGHPRFATFSSEVSEDTRNLIDEIASMSSGVFLWVSLVVKSLLRGLTNHDTLPDLRQRLRELPDELDGLYSHMLDSISPPFYLEQASRLFQLVHQSPRPICDIELSVADDDDVKLTSESSLGSIDLRELERRCNAVKLRLQSRCAGLLEFDVKPSNKPWRELCYVQYLHLTVKEYLEKPEVWSRLLSLTKQSNFDASVSLLRSSIIMLQLRNDPLWENLNKPDLQSSDGNANSASLTELPVIANQSRKKNLWDKATWEAIEYAMSLALQAENSTGSAQADMLGALDKTASRIALEGDSRRCHWTAILHGEEQTCRCPSSFLEYAVSCGLTLYVKNTLNRSSQKREKGHQARSLLDFASWYRPWYVEEPTAQPAMVAMLINNGCHPNETSCSSTAWLGFLNFIVWKCFDEETLECSGDLHQDMLDTCKLLILGGADIRAGHWNTYIKKYIPAWELLSRAFESLPQEQLSELKQMFEEHGVSTEPKLEAQKRQYRPPQSSRRKPRSPGRDEYPHRIGHSKASFRNDNCVSDVYHRNRCQRSRDREHESPYHRFEYRDPYDQAIHQRRRDYHFRRPGWHQRRRGDHFRRPGWRPY